MSSSPALLTAALVALTCASAVLAGCGSSSPKHAISASANTTPAHTTPTRLAQAAPTNQEVDASLAQIKSPDQVIVRIPGREITKRELFRWMSIGSSERLEVPEPPDFNRCIINLRKVEQTSVGGEGRAANELKKVCAERFGEEMQRSLGTLVNDTWLIGEAAEDGIPIDKRELEKNFKIGEAELAKLPGGFAGWLKDTGHTASDVRYEMTATQASDKVYAMIAAKTPKVTPARVARYYQQHKDSYLIPERRDLYILHTRSKAAALRAKAEIQAGKSFAEVTKALKVTQPFGSKDGRDRSLTRKSYGQHNLINAIFSAHPGVLSGPFELHFDSNRYIALGFYVYKVIHKLPPHQLSLAEAKGQVEQQLATALRADTRKDFVKAYKAKWRARTDCAPGYVIENCRQYKGKESESADPYVL